MPKNATIYNCEPCDFASSKQSNYAKHILTRKHLRYTNDIKKMPKIVNAHFCECGKKYKHSSGVWRHKKVCTTATINENTIENVSEKEEQDSAAEDASEEMQFDASNNIIQLLVKEQKDFKTLLLDLMKNNSDLQKQMLEMCKTTPPTTTITGTTINNNKTFNLQFFLNEQCKNAMNLNEFVDSFNLVVDDLLRVGAKGYIEGISQIIIEKLKALDIYKRPIHCSDVRRDTLFIKTDDVWCKDEAGNEKMAIAIKNIGNQNFLLLNEYRKLHPDCLDAASEFNDPYSRLIIQVAGGSVKENVTKILKKIAKEVAIDKTGI
jgi:hypothetical protein